MKKLFKGILCLVTGVLLLSSGSNFLQARFGKNSGLPLQTAIAQNASENVLLVNASNPLPDGFDAGELVDLYSEKRYFQLAASDISLTREAFEAANQMFHQAKKDGVTGFTITSGYRTEEKQQELYNNRTDNTAAKPGTSEHQTGLAFDVTTRSDSGSFDGTEQFRWLNENCWDFGFILRYPEGKEDITGYPYEPWHYRYVGVEIAQEIHENGWTLEEYCERNGD
jgi:D-alanyl-D-alanine carboxypeptidase